VVDREMTSCVHWGAWKWAVQREARGWSEQAVGGVQGNLAPAGDEGKSFS